MVELCSHLIAKKPAGAPWGYSPGTNILRVAPDQIAESAFMRNLLGSSDDTYLIQGADLGTQTAVNAKDFTINNGSKDQEVEDLAAAFPYRGIAVLLLTFFVKTVDLGDLPRLVISTYECNAIWISNHGLSEKALLAQL